MVHRTIGILGSNGFLGSNLLSDLNGFGITKSNYHVKKDFDVFINANGNSKKLLPETDPLLDFDQNVRNTLKSILDFKFDIYIYLSSCEAETDSKYGFSKHLAECVLKKYCKKWIVLRLNGPIGPNMKKGPVYDILHSDRLWIASKSQFQLLHTKYISQFISLLLDKDIMNETINLTGKDQISLDEIMVILNKSVKSPENPVITHNFCINKANEIMLMPSSIDSINKLKENL